MKTVHDEIMSFGMAQRIEEFGIIWSHAIDGVFACEREWKICGFPFHFQNSQDFLVATL